MGPEGFEFERQKVSLESSLDTPVKSFTISSMESESSDMRVL